MISLQHKLSLPCISGADLSLQSILSHVPKHNDHTKIKLFILIYAPALKDSVIETATARPPASLSSSFSMVGHEQTMTPGDEVKNPLYELIQDCSQFHESTC